MGSGMHMGSGTLCQDLAKLVDKYLKNENLQVEDYLFALSRIAAVYIDNVHPSNNEPKERERIIDEYLRYFSMNLSAVGFDNVIKEMINKHNSTFACFTFSTLIYTFFR